jgi:hypothetical protein
VTVLVILTLIAVAVGIEILRANERINQDIDHLKTQLLLRGSEDNHDR